MNAQPAGEHDEATEVREDGGRAFVFKNRGTLLAIPALMFVAFGKPTRRSVAIGLPLAIAGEGLRCWAVGYSGVTTRGDRVTAPELVTAGPYAHVRNPLYLGNLVTGLGFAIAFAGGLPRRKRSRMIALGLGSMIAVYAAIIPHEEQFLARTFGDDYADYQTRVPAMGWRVKPAMFARGRYDPSVILSAETRTFATFGAMVLALALKARR
jgi:protein-S-isoprenylcysteine O-methyltransferase Ste14